MGCPASDVIEMPCKSPRLQKLLLKGAVALGCRGYVGISVFCGQIICKSEGGLTLGSQFLWFSWVLGISVLLVVESLANQRVSWLYGFNSDCFRWCPGVSVPAGKNM